MEANSKGYGFVDGAYLRSLTAEVGNPFPSVLTAVGHVLERQQWNLNGYYVHEAVYLRRTLYYDADKPPEERDENDHTLEEYWSKLERVPDVELRFGEYRAKTARRKAEQKGVDVQLAVDMLVGAFSALYGVAVLVAGDADFVPVVVEVKRRGPTVIVAGTAASTAKKLIEAADRFFELDPRAVPPLDAAGR